MDSHREKEVISLSYKLGTTKDGHIYMLFPDLLFDLTDDAKVEKAEAVCRSAATVLFAIQNDIDVDDIKF